MENTSCNFYVVLDADGESGWCFDTIDTARKRALALGLHPDDFMVIQGERSTAECYGVFADKRWRGGVFDTIDEAIAYAEHKGLETYGVYPSQVSKISASVFEKEDGIVVYDSRNETQGGEK